MGVSVLQGCPYFRNIRIMAPRTGQAFLCCVLYSHTVAHPDGQSTTYLVLWINLNCFPYIGRVSTLDPCLRNCMGLFYFAKLSELKQSENGVMTHN